MLPVQPISKELIAQGMTLDGRVFRVSKIRTNMPMPGTQSDTHVAVDISGTKDVADQSFGFADEGDAKAFVTGVGPVEVQILDAYGNAGRGYREGLGVPEAMVAARGGETVFRAPQPAAVVPPPAPTNPEAAAAMAAPPDAAALPHENRSGERSHVGATVDAGNGGAMQPAGAVPGAQEVRGANTASHGSSDGPSDRDPGGNKGGKTKDA